MIEKFEIKIIRMKSGEDIIAFVYEDYKNNKIHLKFPKTFYFNYDTETDEESLILVDWMTRKAFAYQEISFPADQILFLSYSNIAFGYDYLYSILDKLDQESDLASKIRKTMSELGSTEDLEELEIGRAHV